MLHFRPLTPSQLRLGQAGAEVLASERNKGDIFFSLSGEKRLRRSVKGKVTHFLYIHPRKRMRESKNLQDQVGIAATPHLIMS